MRPALLTYLAVGIGAGLGGVCRYAITAAFVARFGPGLPLGTFVINVSGSFLIGLISECAQTRTFGIDPLARVGLTAGLLGGYTTFSSFTFEAQTLAGEGAWGTSFVYVVSSVVLGVAACYAGIFVGRLLTQPA